MLITFNRSQVIEVKIQKPESVRAFVFDLEIAVAKPTEPAVDPMSGMLLNLVEVDAILTNLRNSLPPQESLRALVDYCSAFLQAQLSIHGCVLQELSLREKRGFWVASKSGALVMGREETQEWSGGVWRFYSERDFDEALCTTQRLKMAADAAEILHVNSLRALVLENLGTGEKWEFRP